jgi:hypothetical protein
MKTCCCCFFFSFSLAITDNLTHTREGELVKDKIAWIIG